MPPNRNDPDLYIERVDAKWVYDDMLHIPLLDEAEKRGLDIEFINRTSYNEMVVNKILNGEGKVKKVKLKINAARRRKKFEKKKVGIHKKIW